MLGALVAPTLLDIGAGRGDVTAVLARGLGVPAPGVSAMESSAPLRKRLKGAGYRACANFDELGGERFGAVSLLNVLDRCDDPHGLLTAATRRLLPGGLLLVAAALPFCAKVYRGVVDRVGAHRPPSTPLTLPHSYRCEQSPRRSFEQHAAAFAATAFPGTFRSPLPVPAPLRLLSWTRVPYLCMGDGTRTFYRLDDALFVLRRAPAYDAPHDPRLLGP